MEPQDAKHGKLWTWLDERVGLKELDKLAKHKQVPVHRHSVWYYFGGMTLFLFTVQVVTGILLLLYYRPSAENAFESVQFIITEVKFGWLIRSSDPSGGSRITRPRTRRARGRRAARRSPSPACCAAT